MPRDAIFRSLPPLPQYPASSFLVPTFFILSSSLSSALGPNRGICYKGPR